MSIEEAVEKQQHIVDVLKESADYKPGTATYKRVKLLQKQIDWVERSKANGKL